MCLFILITPNPKPRSYDSYIEKTPRKHGIAKLRQRLHELIFNPRGDDDDTSRLRRSGACSPPSYHGRHSYPNIHPPNLAFEIEEEDDGQDSITLGSSEPRPSVLIDRDSGIVV